MRNISFITTLSLGLASSLAAQKQANVWHFGENLQLDFSSGAPVSVPGSQMFSFEGCASYSDENGNFLFYTNGGGREAMSQQDEGHIWNRNNAVIYNMQGIEGGGFSAAQSSVILEAPGQDSVYYIFTMDELEFDIGASPAVLAAQPAGRGLRYFTVDMRLNNGLGGVVLVDQLVEQPSFEAICAIRHSNQSDHWILINQDSVGGATNTTNLGVYAVTAAGVAAHSIYQNAYAGTLKASPDGRKVAMEDLLLDFDPATGILSNPLSLTNRSNYQEFSPNSRYLYVSRGNFQQSTVYRYDLQAANVLTSEILVQAMTGGGSNGQMQLAPDGNIYFCQVDFLAGTNSLHRIKCPNTTGASVEENLFPFGSYGLPNFSAWIFENYDSLFVSLGPDSINLAQVGGSYVLQAGNPGASYNWSTGATTQTITATLPGTYTVTVTGNCGSGTDSIVVINSPLVGIQVGDEARSVTLYPHPARVQLTVKVGPDLSDTAYRIHDLQGRVVLSGWLQTSTTQIDIQQLQAGMYIFRAGGRKSRAFVVAR
jgi:hypothetical protein